MKALIVDDSRAMRTILSRLVRKAGADEVVEAGNGLDAINRLEGADVPDLALVDWNMPVMNGLELVINIRKKPEWRRMAIMMVTTESEHGQVVRALAAGAHEYLIKPFDEQSFLDKLAYLGFSAPGPAVEAELDGAEEDN